jgi:hypothetical protein
MKFYLFIGKQVKKLSFLKNGGKTPSLFVKWDLYIDSFFLVIFDEPYASKGACTVPKGYNLILINRLYRERLLFLGQDIDSEISN